MLIEFLAVYSTLLGLLFGFLALFSDVRDKHGKITRLAVAIGSGIFLTGLLTLIVGSMQNKIADSEKEEEIKRILKQIYTENSRLAPEDIELRMDYVCRTEGDEEIADNAEGAGTVFQMPGWHLTITIQANGRKGTLTTTATEAIMPRTRYYAGAEHFGDVKAKAMQFSDFELGKADEFVYPGAWNNAAIRLDFNGTDSSIFSTAFVVTVDSESGQPDAADDRLIYDNQSSCSFDFGDYPDKVNLDPGNLGLDTSDSSTEYVAFLPAQFDIELTIKGIFVGKTSGFIYQIRDEVAFRRGNEKTGAIFTDINTGGDLFPDIELKPHIPVDVVATVGYPSLALAVSIGLLCLMLVGWIVLKRLSGN